MRRFHTINTLTEHVSFSNANAEFPSAESSRTLACFGESEEDGYDDEQDQNWDGCCEDPYDDEEDEEEIEREWCD